MQQRPFVFSGLFAAAFAAVMVLMLASVSSESGTPVWLLRATFALLGSLAVVAAEALWRVRPWAWRVSAALALAHTVAALAWGFAMQGWNGAGTAAMYLFLSAFVVVPILANLYQRTVAPPHLAGQRRPVRAPGAVPWTP
jgi:peptidoglycan/LPS O-acetylase OafA/YrhL